MAQFRTIDQILNRALELIAQHELVKSPLAFDSAGKPIRITKFRNYDGFDNNPNGLTLSLYPYNYSSSSLTTTSPNAALVYSPHHVGDGIRRGSFEEGAFNLFVKLSTTGMSISRDTLGGVALETNEYERALMKWLEVLRLILLSPEVSKVGGLVKNSRIQYGDFKSANWTGREQDGGKGGNAVLHSAVLMWQLDHWPVRDIRSIPFNRVPEKTEGWRHIGVRTSDQMDIYYDLDRQEIFTLSGYPLRSTPAGVPVKWNHQLQRFEHRDTSDPLTAPQMADKDAPAGKPWIDLNLHIVGILEGQESRHLYAHRVTGELVFSDETPVTGLPGDDLIGWDAGSQRITYPEGSEDVGNLQVTLPGGAKVIDFTAPGRALVRVHDHLGTRQREYFKVD